MVPVWMIVVYTLLSILNLAYYGFAVFVIVLFNALTMLQRGGSTTNRTFDLAYLVKLLGFKMTLESLDTNASRSGKVVQPVQWIMWSFIAGISASALSLIVGSLIVWAITGQFYDYLLVMIATSVINAVSLLSIVIARLITLNQ
ncbi:hypothetical protein YASMINEVIRUS_563 [Yasminevirus sp. GU-2018]|uniref:Uncharacterized protein n=1 Tax=Yasminevirus sp. GU-2018 TaxID=2420051 RepID=A0A5K0U8H0_9VIRU|nr:hypothetical protein YASMINEVIRUS_563 [Yasminevirus sp. GU-2018]